MTSFDTLDIPDSGYDAVIFDLDGTLVDSMPAHFKAWCGALAKHGAGSVFPEDVFYAMGGRPTKDIVRELNGECGLKLDPEMVAIDKRSAFLDSLDEVEINEEVVAFARSLRGKMPMAIATGGTRLVVEKTLQSTGLSDLFDEVVTANDVKCGKPAPDIFLEAASRLEIAPERCLVLEDAPAGIMGAQSAGMEVVCVPAPVRIS
ncbi:HAD family phosphatase [Verrucomicrobiaceae bacterium R5-34]|uniref:HAD family phosphatase n=1 Tax=Oceaniferula flava TaxID=2800421 RepID=A0AAE2VCZ7_9BACT|nr:HAD family phosphatase [Oceaniferula flavus]MBK1829718.1 HAD family phosphatase [Verrucomicrobiaceae bacterium R5-34]MBK1853904.1 HAD family phosphatase [Oceaniferula flavus]MBM1135210.1 HAD family phosphatase [Oceaniferula flavus]